MIGGNYFHISFSQAIFLPIYSVIKFGILSSSVKILTRVFIPIKSKTEVDPERLLTSYIVLDTMKMSYTRGTPWDHGPTH